MILCLNIHQAESHKIHRWAHKRLDNHAVSSTNGINAQTCWTGKSKGYLRLSAMLPVLMGLLSFLSGDGERRVGLGKKISIDWLSDWVTGWLTDWLTGRLAGWLVFEGNCKWEHTRDFRLLKTPIKVQKADRWVHLATLPLVTCIDAVTYPLISL